MRKPNYQQQKKQKEEARKVRQQEKQNRRAVRPDEAGSDTGAPAADTPLNQPNPGP